MFDTELIEQLARELNQSKNSRVQIEQFTKRFPDMTIEDGYKISRTWVAMQLACSFKPDSVDSKPVARNTA
ncbi:hypothetical protein [Advenella alkanexedens]|uniref:hypothetical protein n=1 Tax=Advenella alkanexedens TaxID=1481665 RepID=UPI00267472AD|nr:hypothetical protein [Advenella alkanexedens]WKU19260.1 hypothetical protein Q3V95_13400 [Advenella alkanexedens]